MRAVGADGAQKRGERVDVDALVLRNIGERIDGERLTIHYAVTVVADDARVEHGAGLR